MSEILIETVGTNRYAPAAAQSVDTYIYNGSADMTLGQLVMAVCIRRAAALETASVEKMNELNATNVKLQAYSKVMEQLATADSLDTAIDIASTGFTPSKVSRTATIREFLVTECGISSTSLPSSLSTSADREKAIDALKALVDPLSQTSQEQTIDLQSLVSRRDVTYNTSSATVKRLMQDQLNVASNF